MSDICAGCDCLHIGHEVAYYRELFLLRSRCLFYQLLLHDAKAIDEARPASIPFGVGDGAIAKALGEEESLELLSTEKDDNAFRTPVPSIGSFACEEKFEKVRGALDPSNFGVAREDEGLLT